MKSSEDLQKYMKLGRVYRHSELKLYSKATDRDFRYLVKNGQVQKVGRGLYYRPTKNPFGLTPPDTKDLVRAFLDTDDFLVTSCNHFNQLGLGLTQVYNEVLVYNHKRRGLYILDGKRMQFRKVSAYPKRITKEYLLVDMLNNLMELPDNVERVMRTLKARFQEYNTPLFRKNLSKYGRRNAIRILKRLERNG